MMGKVRDYLLGAAGMTVFAMLIAMLTSGRAITQVRHTTQTQDVNEPALQPFHQGANPILSGTVGGDDFDFTVPAGKRAVIEYGTIAASIPTGQRFVEVRLDTTLNGAVKPHHFVLNQQATNVNGEDLYASSQEMRVYADPGTIVHIQVLRSDGSGTASVMAQISGHFVDIVAQ